MKKLDNPLFIKYRFNGVTDALFQTGVVVRPTILVEFLESDEQLRTFPAVFRRIIREKITSN